MRPHPGLLAFVSGVLAVSACGGAIAPGSTDKDQQSTGAGSGSGPSGGTGGGTLDAGTGPTPIGQPVACTPVAAGSGFPGSSVPVQLAAISEPAGIAVDAQYAYVASYEVGPLYRVALKDGTTTTLDSQGVTNIAINSTTVFSIGFPDISSTTGLVVSCAKAGCGGSYTTIASGQSGVWGVAADDAYVYWTNQYGSSMPGLMRAPANGGAPTVLAGGVAADSIALGGGRVFYTATENGLGGTSGLYSVPVGGGAPTTVVSPPEDGSVFSITLDCANVYYMLTDGTVGKIPFAGGPAVVLATGARQSLQMAVDEQYLYFGMDAGVSYVPVDGGAVKTIPGTGYYSGIAVDDRALYWTPTEGGLMRMAK